jgi:DNA-binding transcriptional LysR family regulator
MFSMYGILRVNITGTNLNLFVAFDALIRESSVSRAAVRVGITQSAMSNALRQLRAVFADPLFLRGSHGVTPTPRALELAGPVREALRLLELALNPGTFDPMSATQTFTLFASDYVEFVLLPLLLSEMRKLAPNARLQVLPWGQHRVPEELARGQADLMIGYYDSVPPACRELILFEERYVCIVRKGHPQVRKKLTLKTYAALKHVMVSQTAGATSGIDRALADAGYSRDVSVRVSHFMNVPALVAHSDLVASLSRRVALPFAKVHSLRVFDPPLKLRPGRVGMVWHALREEDPAQRWFRNLVTQVCKRV